MGLQNPKERLGLGVHLVSPLPSRQASLLGYSAGHILSPAFIPARSNQDLSALPWGALVPHVPQPLPSTVSSLSLAFSQGHFPIRKIISDPSHTLESQLQDPAM